MASKSPPLASAVLFAQLAAGCAETLPLTSYERCALRGMELTGVTESQGSARVVTGWGANARVGHARSSGTNIQCAVVRNDIKRYCEVEAYQASAVYKMHHDWITKSTRDRIRQEAVNVWQETYQSCITPEPAPRKTLGKPISKEKKDRPMSSFRRAEPPSDTQGDGGANDVK